MRRFSLLFVILGCAALAAFLVWMLLFTESPKARRAAVGQAPPVAQALAPFKRIEIVGHALVTLVQGDSPGVTVETPGRKPAQVDFEVSGDTLEIHASSQTRWWNMLFSRGDAGTAIIVVTFRELEAVELAGAVELIAGELRVPELTIQGAGGTSIRIDRLKARTLRISGAGALKARIGGVVATQDIKIAGAGEFHGAGLRSEDATVSVSGAGRVVVNARRTLDAQISGAGSVEYLGDPKVTERISGAGRVHQRGAVTTTPAYLADAS